jgi:hypothetical protein
MVTNYPHRIAPRGRVDIDTDARPADDGFVTRVISRVRQMFCGLHGHDTLPQFEKDRICLKCVSCGHETPGWALTETPPAITVRGENRRRVLRPQLIGARRIA